MVRVWSTSSIEKIQVSLWDKDLRFGFSKEFVGVEDDPSKFGSEVDSDQSQEINLLLICIQKSNMTKISTYKYLI